MLTQEQMRFMNRPIFGWGGHCVGFEREFLRGEVVELVLESVHAGNLGPLPPSPDMIAYKAIQIGIISSFAEAYVTRRCGQFG